MESGAVRWDQRITRAGELTGRYPAAAEILTFYCRLAAYQKSLACRAGGRPGHPAAASGADLLDPDAAVAIIPDVIAWVEATGPAVLVRAAQAMRSIDPAAWRHLVDARLARPPLPVEPGQEPQTFVVEAVLMPLAERAALAHAARDAPSTLSAALMAAGQHCPACGDHPLVGVLREEGQGAKRSLVCALCLTEWECGRLLCPSCGEQRFDALPVFTAEQFGHVRIEACESCRCYVKTIDLTKDGHAVPLVDDLATVPLDLWAREQGYRRLRGNLLAM